MTIPLFDTATPQAPLQDESTRRIGEVIERGAFILGPEVQAFEREFAELPRRPPRDRRRQRHRRDHDRAPGAGRPPGRRGGGAVVHVLRDRRGRRHAGARPVFCDVDPDTRNITAETVKAVMTPRTKAIVAVDLFGLPAPLDELAEPWRAGARGRGPGRRGEPRGTAVRGRSPTPRRSRSTPPRTSAPSATAARSRPTTTTSQRSRAPCASTVRATSRASSTSATTRGSTRFRRRSCGSCWPSSTTGAIAAERPPTRMRRPGSPSTYPRPRYPTAPSPRGTCTW